MPKQDPAAFRTVFSTPYGSAYSSASNSAFRTTEPGAAQDTGPAPTTARRPPLRELPRTGRRGAPAARNRFQAPRRTY
ncbi:hypothetical protein OG462_23245 [Streptomyces sp. NBC_01077]|uniref:hypothetical protein n=1 Tax=Streptomyces sp. NBC_01077 TaxID=2903746 RepID=UPI00387023C2|nr:hypothetical protein OG462_23245 [Streptomyces sp. NBC_01077]